MFTRTLRHAVAQMVMPRIDGRRLSDPAYFSERAALAREGIGGFILFGGDIESTPGRLREIGRSAEIPLLISSDVERGLGQQLEGGTRFPSQRAVASAIDRRSRQDGELLSAMLDAVRSETRAAGIHVVFSPVMDVNNNPDNPIICTRAFGDDPEIVEWFGSRYIRRLQRPRPDGTRDLLACAKHFPGHGDTDLDSHAVLPVIRADRMRLNRVELPPFREAVKDGVGSVMIGHLLVPALDPLKPVTFSKKVVTALLREGMEFNGLIVSDALDMGALAAEYTSEDIAVRAVEAGMDILLHPVDARKTIDAVEKAVAAGIVTEQRILESAARIMEAKQRLGLFRAEEPIAPELDRARHRAIAARLARKAIRIVRGKRDTLPLDRKRGAACFILDDDGRNAGEAFRRRVIELFDDGRITALGPDAQGALEPGAAGAVVIAIFSKVSASKGRSGLAPKLRDAAFTIVERARQAKRPCVVISFDSPYILDQFRGADVLIAGYDRMDAIQQAAAELLAGGA